MVRTCWERWFRIQVSARTDTLRRVDPVQRSVFVRWLTMIECSGQGGTYEEAFASFFGIGICGHAVFL